MRKRYFYCPPSQPDTRLILKVSVPAILSHLLEKNPKLLIEAKAAG